MAGAQTKEGVGTPMVTSPTPRQRVPSEVIRRGYSDEEVANIYQLGRAFLETGSLRRAEAIFSGLSEVCPDFRPAWMGLTYVHLYSKDLQNALQAARTALRLDPQSVETMLFIVICSMGLGDFNSAGSWLGEVRDRIEGGQVHDNHLIRLYRAQLARYQSR